MLGIRPPAVHDLRVLFELILSGAVPPPDRLSLLQAVQPFAVEDRYPLVTPREAVRAEVVAWIPAVEAETQALETAIDAARVTTP